MATRTPLKKVPIHLQSAQMRILIKGGKIINDDYSHFADIYIEDGSIKMIGSNLVVPGGARVIDAKGMLIIPGGIDASTHFLHPPSTSPTPMDDIYLGTKAALAGGTTMIIDYIKPEKDQSLLEAYNKTIELAIDKTCCDFSVKIQLKNFNDKINQEMEILVKDKGINSFHINMGEDDWSREELVGVVKRCKQLKVLLSVKAENKNIVEELTKEMLSLGITGPEGLLLAHPEEAEIESIYNITSLCANENLPLLICDLSSRDSSDVITQKRKKGNIIFSSTSIPRLLFTGKEYRDKSWVSSSSFVVIPPLRDNPSNPHNLTCLLSNDDINLLTSDHVTFTIPQRALGANNFSKIPPGLPGVQERMGLAWKQGVLTGSMDMNKFVSITSTFPAKIFNLYPKKGRISVGSDADIVIWNPEKIIKINKNNKENNKENNKQEIEKYIYEGLDVKGGPFIVITAGSVVLDEEGFRVTQGNGQFVSLPPFSHFLYDRVSERDKIKKYKKIEREDYKGPTYSNQSVIEGEELNNKISQSEKDEFHNRITRSGTRHQQDSSFHLSGAQIDDTQPQKTSMKVSQPPGGKSTHLW